MSRTAPINQNKHQEYYRNFGKRLLAYRKKFGYSQETLAEKIGLDSRSYISDLENQDPCQAPSIPMLLNLSDVFRCHPGTFFLPLNQPDTLPEVFRAAIRMLKEGDSIDKIVRIVPCDPDFLQIIKDEFHL